MKVMKNSPAEAAGLIPEDDYLLGIMNFGYSDLDDLCSFLDLLPECEIKTIELFVYNKKTQKIRYAFMTPNKDWGGGGHLGIEFGTGYLNRMPDYQSQQFNEYPDEEEEEGNEIPLLEIEQLDQEEEELEQIEFIDPKGVDKVEVEGGECVEEEKVQEETK